MNTLVRLMLFGLWPLLPSLGPASLWAQGRTPRQNGCFVIHVRLNGAPVDGPRVITLKTREGERSVPFEGGCFRVPPALLTEKVLDVFFTVPGNALSMSSISTGFFEGPWDIYLEDKKFGRTVSLPKHTRARDACAIVFHVGEPETELLQAPCRRPQ